MPVAFKGEELFGPGPHRCALGPLGEYVLTNAAANLFQAGSTPIGPLELAITVRGRLVADTEEDLWSMRDAVATLLTDPPQIGPLIDTTGREWEEMSFVRFAQEDRRDRGRVFSLAFTATFVRFLV